LLPIFRHTHLSFSSFFKRRMWILRYQQIQHIHTYPMVTQFGVTRLCRTMLGTSQPWWCREPSVGNCQCHGSTSHFGTHWQRNRSGKNKLLYIGCVFLGGQKIIWQHITIRVQQDSDGFSDVFPCFSAKHSRGTGHVVQEVVGNVSLEAAHVAGCRISTSWAFCTKIAEIYRCSSPQISVSKVLTCFNPSWCRWDVPFLQMTWVNLSKPGRKKHSDPGKWYPLDCGS